MTPSKLKWEVQNTNTDKYFFTRDTMKFFGDTMSNYGVRAKPVMVNGQTCWELYRRRAVKNNIIDSAFFDVITFKRVIPNVSIVECS
jgi:hypothetical protein